MTKTRIDFIGEVFLHKESHRTKPFIKFWFGQAKHQGDSRSDSYYIRLLDKEQISPGERAKAEFSYKFGDDDRFQIDVEAGQTIEIYEGNMEIGEFTIGEIINEKFR